MNRDKGAEEPNDTDDRHDEGTKGLEEKRRSSS